MSLPRVLVADDHAATRTGVRIALEQGGFIVCAEAEDARHAVLAAVRERPDVCLLEVRMPGGGIEAAAEIAARLPDVCIVMLTVSAADADLFAALRAGARGYLFKDTDPKRLPLALRGVLEGEAALPRSLVARVLREFRERNPRRVSLGDGRRASELTAREWDVLELLGEGLTTAEIGKRLSISPVTVRRHVSHVRHKLGVPDRKAAISLLRDPPAP